LILTNSNAIPACYTNFESKRLFGYKLEEFSRASASLLEITCLDTKVEELLRASLLEKLPVEKLSKTLLACIQTSP